MAVGVLGLTETTLEDLTFPGVLVGLADLPALTLGVLGLTEPPGLTFGVLRFAKISLSDIPTLLRSGTLAGFSLVASSRIEPMSAIGCVTHRCQLGDTGSRPGHAHCDRALGRRPSGEPWRAMSSQIANRLSKVASSSRAAQSKERRRGRRRVATGVQAR